MLPFLIFQWPIPTLSTDFLPFFRCNHILLWSWLLLCQGLLPVVPRETLALALGIRLNFFLTVSSNCGLTWISVFRDHLPGGSIFHVRHFQKCVWNLP
jgi:hypothetical protein